MKDGVSCKKLKRRKEKRKRNVPSLARLPSEPAMDGGAEAD